MGLVGFLHNNMGDLQHSVFMGLVGFFYDKMGTYNIALYGSGRFLV